MNKHNHCMPLLAPSVGIISDDKELRSAQDVDDTCMCTMMELCKVLTTMDDNKSRHSLICFIHKATEEQRGKTI